MARSDSVTPTLSAAVFVSLGVQPAIWRTSRTHLTRDSEALLCRKKRYLDGFGVVLAHNVSIKGDPVRATGPRAKPRQRTWQTCFFALHVSDEWHHFFALKTRVFHSVMVLLSMINLYLFRMKHKVIIFNDVPFVVLIDFGLTRSSVDFHYRKGLLTIG